MKCKTRWEKERFDLQVSIISDLTQFLRWHRPVRRKIRHDLTSSYDVIKIKLTIIMYKDKINNSNKIKFVVLSL